MTALAGVAAKEALRSRLVLVVLGLTLAVLVALAWSSTGDGTAAGRLRNFVSWGATWIALTLSMTTVFLSTTLALALKDGRLVQVTTGPLRREWVPVAWWLGHAAVLAGLVAVSHLALGGLAVAIRHTSPRGERAALDRVLQARALVKPRPPDPAWIERRVAARLEELRRRGDLRELKDDPDRVEQVVVELEGQLRRGLRTVPPGRRLRWEVADLPAADPEGTFTLLFSYQATDARGQPLPSGRGPQGRFALVAPGGDAIEQAGRWPAGASHEMLAPAGILGGGRLVVEYTNEERRPVVVTFPEAGPTVLLPAGGFGSNLARGALVLLGRLLFLAAIGAGMAALIDGKLAALAALFFLAVGSAHGFLRDALRQNDAFGAASDFVGVGLSWFLALIPDLGRDDLPQLLAGGLLVEPGAAARAVLLEGLGLGGLLLGCAALLFGRRELGVIR